MRNLDIARWLVCLSLVLSGGMSPAMAQQAKSATPAAAKSQQSVDGIAAVVNKHVITLHQVDVQAARAVKQLKQQKISVPDQQTLRYQVLQRMITDELITQEAARLDIKVSDAEVQQAIKNIASRNKITLAKLRAEIERSGASWDDYAKQLQHEILVDRLRQRTVDRHIHISDADVDAYLKAQQRQPGLAVLAGQQARQTASSVIGLAQILVAVPEGAPASQVQQLRSKAEQLLARLRGGADFASVAAASSDAPEALQGGDLGVRPAEGWPDLFLSAIQNVPEGSVSGIVQSGNGFHILKVVTRGSPGQKAQAQTRPPEAQASPPLPEGPIIVTQTHARHILIKITPAMTQEHALERIQQLRQRLVMGENFEELARLYSEDSSAPQGGDLGWLNPGESVPAFEQAMDALQPGQLSEPVLTQYGWHLIKVEERRQKDMENEYRRIQARQVLFQKQVEPAFEDWLNQLHGKAYIDNRLDPARGRRAP